MTSKSIHLLHTRRSVSSRRYRLACSSDIGLFAKVALRIFLESVSAYINLAHFKRAKLIPDVSEEFVQTEQNNVFVLTKVPLLMTYVRDVHFKKEITLTGCEIEDGYCDYADYLGLIKSALLKDVNV